MRTKSNIYRTIALFFPLLCCWLGGCSENGNDSPAWHDRSEPIKADPGTTVNPDTKIKLTANATDPDGDLIRYFWRVTDPATGSEVIDQVFLEESPVGPEKVFQSDSIGLYRVEVEVRDIHHSDPIKGIPSLIKVIYASPITYPEKGYVVAQKETIEGTEILSDQPSGVDPLIRYTLNILVIKLGNDDQELYGVLHSPLEIRPDGTWKQPIDIGEDNDQGSRFILRLVLIDRQKFKDLQGIFPDNIGILPAKTNIEFLRNLVEQYLSDIYPNEHVSVGEVFDESFCQIRVSRR